MNRALVDRIADAVLYEGYILYPYRPSVKNRQRWTFGGLYPEAYSQAHAASDPWFNQTECLIRGTTETTVEVIVRFLHLTARTVGEVAPPLTEWVEDAEPPLRLVEQLQIGVEVYHAWQEAEAREIGPIEMVLGVGQTRRAFALPGRRWLEPLHAADGTIPGVAIREQQALAGVIALTAAPVADELFRLSLIVENRTPLEDAAAANRDDALMRSLVSTHALLGVRGGEFVSLTDPPDDCRDAVANCRNVGVWPVLVGEEGQRDMLLSSPIILPDYPQVAPESPRDLFDATEIDEILSLRILTLTDEEKRQVAGADKRAKQMLARTEALTREQLLGLHGTVRGLQPVTREEARG